MLVENENSVVRKLLFGRPHFTDSTNKEINHYFRFNKQAIQLSSFLKLSNSSKSDSAWVSPLYFLV